MNDVILIDFESIFIILFQSRCMSDPSISDIDFKNKMALIWTTLKIEILELESFFYEILLFMENNCITLKGSLANSYAN